MDFKGGGLMLNKHKKGAAYIDTVITIFLSVMMIAVAINLLSYYNTYHKLDYIAQEMLRSAVMHGEATSVAMGNRYEELKAQTKLGNKEDGSLGYGKTKNLKISFEGSEFIDNPNNTTGAVQRLDTIKVTVQCTAHMRLLGNMGIIELPMSVTKTGLSENYWNIGSTDNEEPNPFEGSSENWEVNGNTLVRYKGLVTNGMELIIPNKVDGIPITAVGHQGINILNQDTPITISNIMIADGINKIGSHVFSDIIFENDVILPESIMEIDDGAFIRTTIKGSLILSNNIQIINQRAFYNANIYEPIYIPDSVTNIGEEAFCSINIEIAECQFNKAIVIQQSAFSSATFVGDIRFEHNNTLILNLAFADTKGSYAVYIPSSASLHSTAFLNSTLTVVRTYN